MVIAVNARLLIRDRLEGCGYFLKETLRVLVQQHPDDLFYLFFDRPWDQEFLFGPNVIPVVVPPPTRHPLLWKLWFDVQVPRFLKKFRADVFLSTDGFCSLTTRIPQCLVIHDLGFLHFPESYQGSHAAYYRRRVPRFIRKATTIAAVSEFTKQDIIRHYHTAPGLIKVVNNGCRPVFRPLAPEEQEEVRQKYTGGAAYFIHAGAIQPRKNLVRLLRAFSVFKKRQQSGMKLVLAGRLAWKNDEFISLLSNYKYRSEVVLTEYLEEEELARVNASAYALVYPSLFEGFGVPVLEAMRSGVPVLTSRASAMEEVAGDAGLYFDPKDHEDMAEKMMLVYKDEDLRKRMIEKGRLRSEDFSWEKTAGLVWEQLQTAASFLP